MSRHFDTIAALATPVGTAAIALVRVSGVDAGRLAQEIFGVVPLPRRVRHGNYRDRAGVLLDDVVWVFFAGPASYTGEDSLEISCHGNPYVAQRLLEDLLARGCRSAEPGEFTQRAFLGGKMDLSQAEAVMDLIQARSERALVAANRQLRGALGRQMGGLIEALLLGLARVEAYIDFPDEDLPQEDRALVAAQIAQVLRGTERLLATSHYGEVLRQGIKTVIIGEPNAGKSSLLNRLVGRDRAIVSPEPGTTRDFIEEVVNIGPHCLRLIDTAGLNPAPGVVEKLGIEKTFEIAAESDLFVVVMDVNSPALVLDKVLREKMQAGNTLLVWNKIDLAPVPVLSGDFKAWPNVVGVSAATGMGLEVLRARIIALADGLAPSVGEDVVAINARHAQALNQARADLAAATDKLAAGQASELLASDLRGALAALGEISGKVDNERMLDALFANFCIGK
ncbi:MAG: tRNA uridine-5-carboxymethylaminomethyl(34) synthesis GTPase MnmE [Opitutaceae bacterium]